MPTIERFTRGKVLRIVGITPRQLGYWERLQLIQPEALWGEKVYTFADLVSLRTVKQLTEQQVPAGRLCHAIKALRRQLLGVEVPLMELRLLSHGRKIAVEYGGTVLDPLSGQLLLNFDTGGLGCKASASALSARTPEEWFALALNCESNPELRLQAVDAYLHVLEQAPDWVEPHINLGTMLYEEGKLGEAAEHYRCAVALAPDNALAHFNLGSVLDELKKLAPARNHLREAVRLKPAYADAHYNLARTCEQLGAYTEARPHWRCYLQLDPHSRWAEHARKQLAAESDRSSP